MSDHAARLEPKRQSRTARLAIYIGVPVLVLLIWILARLGYLHWYPIDQGWPAFQATVVSTRVVPVGPIDNAYEPGILYRVEVDAAWNDGGSRYEAWVPTEKTNRDRAWLALWAAQQGKRCIVRQNPHNPSARLASFGN
jgi:hypothetical protein